MHYCHLRLLGSLSVTSQGITVEVFWPASTQGGTNGNMKLANESFENMMSSNVRERQEGWHVKGRNVKWTLRLLSTLSWTWVGEGRYTSISFVNYTHATGSNTTETTMRDSHGNHNSLLLIQLTSLSSALSRKCWSLKCHTILWASTVCYRDSVFFWFYLPILKPWFLSCLACSLMTLMTERVLVMFGNVSNIKITIGIQFPGPMLPSSQS
jgi:hypothetical protein